MVLLEDWMAGISGAFTGELGEQELFTGPPTLRQPWGDDWGFPLGDTPTREATEPRFDPKPEFVFIPGDDHADSIARANGVDPHNARGIIRLAKTQIGAPYVWGAADPGPVGSLSPGQRQLYAHEPGARAAFDCSGFTQWLYKRMGVALPHQSTAQAAQLQKVGRNQLQKGDLIFYSYGRLGTGVIDHVEVYIGGNKTIGTPGPGGVAVQQADWEHFVQGGHSDQISAGAVRANTSTGGGGRGRGGGGRKAPDPFREELTVPFPVAFGNAVGTLFTPESRGIAAPRAGKPDPAVTLTMKSSVGELQAVARELVLNRGWNVADYKALVELWGRESGWNPAAVNDETGAVGIPQNNPESREISDEFRHNPLVQIKWGLDYIDQRYGSPTAALRHSDEKGWY